MALLDALVSPVVGRTREMELLNQALRAAANGAGCCILVAGEAGIGKSRLVAEIRSRALVEQFVVWQGHCFEQDVSFPYAPWIDALRAWLAPKSAAEASECLGQFAPELVKLLPELSLVIPSLEPTAPLEPEAEQHRLFESLARLAASLAALNPLLIILEDLHWSDQTSLKLLRFFARRIMSLPIVLVGTYRTDEPSPRSLSLLARLSRDPLVQEIQLGPLARHEVEQMTRALLPSEHPITAGWLDIITHLTEGNPFLSKRSSRVCQNPPSRQRLTSPTASRMPSSIESNHCRRRRTASCLSPQSSVNVSNFPCCKK